MNCINVVSEFETVYDDPRSARYQVYIDLNKFVLEANSMSLNINVKDIETMLFKIVPEQELGTTLIYGKKQYNYNRVCECLSAYFIQNNVPYNTYSKVMDKLYSNYYMAIEDYYEKYYENYYINKYDSENCLLKSVYEHATNQNVVAMHKIINQLKTELKVKNAEYMLQTKDLNRTKTKLIPNVGPRSGNRGYIKIYEIYRSDKSNFTINSKQDIEQIANSNDNFIADGYIFLANQEQNSDKYFNTRTGGFKKTYLNSPNKLPKYEKKRDDLIKELNDYTGDKNTEYYKLLKKRVEDGIRFVDNCKSRIASVYKYKLIAEVGCYGSKEVYEDIISKKYNSAADFGGNKGIFNVEDGTKLLKTFATRPEFTVRKHNDKLKLLEYTLPVISKRSSEA